MRTVIIQSGRRLESSPWRDAARRLDAWPGVRLVASDLGVLVYDVSGARIQGGSDLLADGDQ